MSTTTYVVPEVDERYWPRPRGEWILAVRPSVEEKTAGGIVLTTQTQEFLLLEQTCAKVLELGPEAYKRSTPVVPAEAPYCKPGDWVVYALNQGQEVKVKVDGKTVTFMLLHASHVRAVTEAPELTKTGLSQ